MRPMQDMGSWKASCTRVTILVWVPCSLQSATASKATQMQDKKRRLAQRLLKNTRRQCHCHWGRTSGWFQGRDSWYSVSLVGYACRHKKLSVSEMMPLWDGMNFRHAGGLCLSLFPDGFCGRAFFSLGGMIFFSNGHWNSPTTHLFLTARNLNPSCKNQERIAGWNANECFSMLSLPLLRSSAKIYTPD